MKKSDKVLLALIGGIAIGTALGILIAPGKGSETRGKILDSTRDLSDRLNNIRNKMRGGKSGREDGKSYGVENEINEYVN